jgi:lincosamide nucleotidyltransferase A/C/D/E
MRSEKWLATETAMNGSDVIDVLDRLEAAGIRYWVDGGWGIDALLGAQTRDHEDLDLVVERDECDTALGVLGRAGFAHDVDAQPGLPARLVLRDPAGGRVDLHPVVFDHAGNGWQPLPANAWGAYPAEGLGATGVIDGRPVPCLTAELQLRHHLGYPWDEHDRHDMRLLAERFGLRLPPGLDDNPGEGPTTRRPRRRWPHRTRRRPPA